MCGAMGSSGMVKEMCMDAIVAALDGAACDAEDHAECVEDENDLCSSEEDEEDDDTLDTEPAEGLPLEQNLVNVDEPAGEADEMAGPTSPSIMSIGRPTSPKTPQAMQAAVAATLAAAGETSMRVDSPSIVVLDDAPLWTSHKALPAAPQTPPEPHTPPQRRKAKGKSCRGGRALLGVPEPLSARGRERCEGQVEPLSARGPRKESLLVAKRAANVGGA